MIRWIVAPGVVLATLGAALVMSSSCRQGIEMQNLVPKGSAGWTAVDAGATYDRQTLYDYIDGAAEVYLAYNFRRACAVKFTKGGEAPITVDLFEMDGSEDAYGIFSFERESEEVGLGQGSEYAAGLLRFWKDRFFVSILSERETPAAQEAVFALGRSIAEAIASNGTRPKLVDRLPTRELDQLSVRFLHRHESLNYHFFVADGNVLKLGPDVDAVLGRYSDRSRLFVAQYRSRAAAASAFESFTEAYMPDAVGGAVRTEDGRWTAAKLRGELLAVLFGAVSRERAVSLVDAALRQEDER